MKCLEIWIEEGLWGHKPWRRIISSLGHFPLQAFLFLINTRLCLCPKNKPKIIREPSFVSSQMRCILPHLFIDLVHSMELNQLYFYTASIVNWRALLESDTFKLIIMNSLKYLVDAKKIRVYGFVLMPNHIHLIWELLEFNGKEKPHASFMKYTSHNFQKVLREIDPKELELFYTDKKTRKYQFWQRNSLPIDLYSPDIIYQKLDYIHNNPVHGKWMLSSSRLKYRFSSAGFYEGHEDEFELLTHIGERAWNV